MSALQLLFSKLQREIQKAPIKKATAEEWTNYLRNRGVKQEELQNWQKALENMPQDHSMTSEEAAEQFRVLGDVPIKETRLVPWDARTEEEKYYLLDLLQKDSTELDPKQLRLLDPKYGS